MSQRFKGVKWPLGQHPRPQELHRLYCSGFVGAHVNAETTAEVLQDPGVRVDRFSDACPHLRGLHKQRDVMPLFLPMQQVDRGFYASEPQETGNCVGRGAQGAKGTTNAYEIVVNGEAEQYERPAWETTYALRGHSGAGMDPALAAKVDAELGFLWRREYPFVDLRRQNTAWSVRGSRSITAEVRREMAKHKVGRWIFPETGDEALDLLAAGYACHSGQNCGFSGRPNSKGIHDRSGGWNHDMMTAGYDLSKSVWPEPVVFVPNSWGAWNTQPKCWPRDIWGPPIGGLIICALDVWVRWFVGSRSIFFYADVEGVPAKRVPDWGWLQALGGGTEARASTESDNYEDLSTGDTPGG